MQEGFIVQNHFFKQGIAICKGLRLQIVRKDSLWVSGVRDAQWVAKVCQESVLMLKPEPWALQDVTQKITKLGEVIKIGMGIFNTLDKSEVLDILQTISSRAQLRKP